MEARFLWTLSTNQPAQNFLTADRKVEKSVRLAADPVTNMLPSIRLLGCFAGIIVLYFSVAISDQAQS